MLKVDYQAAGFWFSVGQWIFNVLIAVYLWISRKQTATNKRVEKINSELSNRINETEKSLIRVCTDLEHLPHQKQFDKLSTDITSLTKELGKLDGRLGGINRAVDLINEFLINQGAKQ